MRRTISRALGGRSLLIALVSTCWLPSSCSGAPSRPAGRSTPGPASRTAPLPARLRSVAAEIESGLYPPCAQTVGLPASVVVHGHNVSTGAPEVRCLTGAGDSDATVVYRTICTQNAGDATVYYWASADPTTADQHVYAARSNGRVRAVPGLDAGDLSRHAVALVIIRRAVRC